MLLSRKEFQIFLEERIPNKLFLQVTFLDNQCVKNKKVVKREGYPNSDLIMKNGVLLFIMD